jgi:hypothetical protein
MPPFGFLSRIDWDYVAKVWLPLTTAIVGGALGLWQYHVNSLHDRAATYLSVIDRFGATKQEFDSNYKVITAVYADNGSGNASHAVLASCGIDERKSWLEQVSCFNGHATRKQFSSVLAVLSEFKVLGQYAVSDEYAKQMLRTSLHDKAVLLASNLCDAIWTAQEYMNKLDDSTVSSLSAVKVINQFAEPSPPCDENRAKVQAPKD